MSLSMINLSSILARYCMDRKLQIMVHYLEPLLVYFQVCFQREGIYLNHAALSFAKLAMK